MGWSLDCVVNLVEVPKEHQRGFLFSPFFAFPWFQEWSVLFYPNPREHVNTIS
jgi:hypothetical protein